MGWGCLMARLDAAERKALPNSSFAGPDRSYPIQNESHARAALSMVSRYGSPAEKARVRGAVKRKYGIGDALKKGK